VVFPVPIDLLRGLGNFASAARRESRD